MITQSLCYFPASKRRRRAKAKHDLVRILQVFRPQLRRITAIALVMQLSLVPLPIALHRWLPTLLGSEAGTLSDRTELLWKLLAVVTIASVCRAVANYHYLRLAGKVGHAFVAEVRKLAYAHLLRLPVEYVEKRGAGQLLLRFIGDADALRGWISKAGPRLIADALTAGGIAIALLYLNWALALSLTLPLASFAFVLWWLSPGLRDATRTARRLQSQVSGVVERHLNDIRGSKLRDAESATFSADIRAQLESVAECNGDRDRRAARIEATAQLCIFAALPLFLLVGLPMVWASRLSASDFLAFIWLGVHLLVLFRNSLGALILHQKALVSTQRLYGFLAGSAERGRGRRRRGAEFKTLSVTVDRQTHTFGVGLHQLPRSIAVRDMLDALLGFRAFPPGEIAIDGMNIAQIDVKVRRRRVAVVEAHPQHSAPQDATHVLQQTKQLLAENNRVAILFVLLDESEPAAQLLSEIKFLSPTSMILVSAKSLNAEVLLLP